MYYIYLYIILLYQQLIFKISNIYIIGNLISIYVTQLSNQLYEISEDEGGGELVSFIVPKQLNAGLVNNKKENHKFRYVGICNLLFKTIDI